MTLYIACSLDGFIAGDNDDLSFLNSVEKTGEDYGYTEFIKTIDTVIMGRRTLDWVNKNAPDFSYSDKETYIISHYGPASNESKPNDLMPDPNPETSDEYAPSPKEQSNIHYTGGQSNNKYYSGDLKNLADRLLSENKRIFLVGGAEIILQMLNHQLIDEFIIAVIPVLLGSGIPLFKPGYKGHSLSLTDVRSYDTGVVMLHYSLT